MTEWLGMETFPNGCVKYMPIFETRQTFTVRARRVCKTVLSAINWPVKI
jgi:hypothetical protein